MQAKWRMLDLDSTIISDNGNPTGKSVYSLDKEMFTLTARAMLECRPIVIVVNVDDFPFFSETKNTVLRLA